MASGQPAVILERNFRELVLAVGARQPHGKAVAEELGKLTSLCWPEPRCGRAVWDQCWGGDPRQAEPLGVSSGRVLGPRRLG